MSTKSKNKSVNHDVTAQWKNYGPLAIYNESGNEEESEDDIVPLKKDPNQQQIPKEKRDSHLQPLNRLSLKSTDFKIRSTAKSNTSNNSSRNQFASTLTKLTQLYSKDQNQNRGRVSTNNTFTTTKRKLSKEKANLKSNPLNLVKDLPRGNNLHAAKVLKPAIVQFDTKDFALNQETIGDKGVKGKKAYKR